MLLGKGPCSGMGFAPQVLYSALKLLSTCMPCARGWGRGVAAVLQD